RLSFFFNATATSQIYTLSLHDALPISRLPWERWRSSTAVSRLVLAVAKLACARSPSPSSRDAANSRTIPSRRWLRQSAVVVPPLRCQVELRTWYDAPRWRLGRYSTSSHRSTELNGVLEDPETPPLLL